MQESASKSPLFTHAEKASRSMDEQFVHDQDEALSVATEEMPTVRRKVLPSLFTDTLTEATREAAAEVLVIEALEIYGAVEVQVGFKTLEAVVKRALEINKERAMANLTGTKGAPMVVHGAKLTTSGVREFDYQEDSGLAKLKAEQEAAEAQVKLVKEKIKDRQVMLQKLPFEEVLDPSTGETLKKAIQTKDGSNLVITLSK